MDTVSHLKCEGPSILQRTWVESHHSPLQPSASPHPPVLKRTKQTTHAIHEDTLEGLRRQLTFDLDDGTGGDSDLHDLWPAWTRVINGGL